MESNSHYQPSNLRLHQHSHAPRYCAIDPNLHPGIPQDYSTSQHASISPKILCSMSLTNYCESLEQRLWPSDMPTS